MNRSRLNRFALKALAACALTMLIIGVAGRPSPYALVQPGSVLALGPGVGIPDEYRHDAGWLALTAVRIRQANYAGWLKAHVESSARVISTRDVVPAGSSSSEFDTLLTRWTERSKAAATVVAMRRAGYAIEVAGRGALVEAVRPGSAVAAVVHPGDVILESNGVPIESAEQLTQWFETQAPGETMQLELLRLDERHSVTLTSAASLEPGWPRAQIHTTDYIFDIRTPFAITLDSADTKGESAGLMLSLALVDALTPGDLAAGRRVAGTGAIDVEGRVGPIGGVSQKVIAAEQHGAEVFLAPYQNAAEAGAAARRIQVIPVGTFDDAVDALQRLGGQRS